MPLKSLFRFPNWLLAGCALAGATSLSAITLGEPRLVSEPGRPVVAELPVRDWGRLSPDHIQLRVAPPASWQAAGMQAPEEGRFQLSLKERSDSEAGAIIIECLRSCEGDSLDLLIELQWPNGRLQREVGLLLKPAAGASMIHIPAALWVQPGDTAGAMVASHLDPALDRSQALVALAQANPEAFVGGNVNRLRAGAVLKLPGAAQIKSVDLAQARESIALQMEEYAAYRSEVAAQAGQTSTDPSAQVATGKVQPAQKDKSEKTADQLTLSTSGADGTDEIASQRQARQTAERAAEINRNIQELNRIAQGDDSVGVPMRTPASPRETSELMASWARSPYTPWAALACIVLLAGWIMVRSVKRGEAADGASSVGTQPSTALNLDFDLNLPPADSLPPLPASVHQAPTAVTKENSPSLLTTQSWDGLDLDLSKLSTEFSKDPHALRLDLAQALWQRGLTQTALVLAREVMAQSLGDSAHRARLWLDERA